jgi:predicted nuclease of predicted toxin-antitoxin system
MNFLADESCAGPVIRALREARHDVVAIAEVAKGATDEQVLERAANEKRVLITDGKKLKQRQLIAKPSKPFFLRFVRFRFGICGDLSQRSLRSYYGANLSLGQKSTG